MRKIKKVIASLTKVQKISCLIVIVILTLSILIGIPTLARYKNRNLIMTNPVWDGSISSNYHMGSGTSSDPYVISNGSELAYFCNELSDTDYQDTYFTLNNDIILNTGVFNYDATKGLEYIINGQTYYIDEYTNNYYHNANRTGGVVGTVNIFSSLDNFKGRFDGKSFTIYGLYITDETEKELALFTNLQGSINDLYVDNAVIYGGNITGGIASSTSNANLYNILFNGFVIGQKILTQDNIAISLSPIEIEMSSVETTTNMNLTNNLPLAGREIISTSLTGNYVIEGSGTSNIKVNGQTVTDGSFNISLGTSILSSVPIVTSSTIPSTVTFSNLNYNVVYKYGVAGGIVAYSNNTIMENIINKSYVYGYSVSGGLVGVTTSSLSINQTYNNGAVNSDNISGGLIGVIERSNDVVSITKSYNTEDITAPTIGGLVGVIKDNIEDINIDKTFDITDTYVIGNVSNTTVNVTSSYYTGYNAVGSGTVTGNFTITSLTYLEDKTYDINNLSYSEFVSFADLEINEGNAWLYEAGSLPILFLDDIKNPIANIYVSTYHWDNLSYELSTIGLNSSVTFSVEAMDELRPLQAIYYYISNDSEALTYNEILAISTWTSYSNIVQLSTEGEYVIYIKAVDYNNNVTYLNTDLLILDTTNPGAEIAINNSAWSTYSSSLDYLYLDGRYDLTISATDYLSGVASVKYYFSNGILTTAQLNSLPLGSWKNYSEAIALEEGTISILYAQIIDKANNKIYVNSDYLVFKCYTGNELTMGRNTTSYVGVEPYITDKSTITLNFSYTDSTLINYINYTHNIMSNILLPLGSKIIVIDNIKEKVYEYEIATSQDIFNYEDSCSISDPSCEKKATYPLTLFRELGNTNNYYQEISYEVNGSIAEDFTIILDLAKTDITTDYLNVALFMELHDLLGANFRPTIYETIEKFNIITNKDSIFDLSLTGETPEIIFNSDSTTNIELTTKIDYQLSSDIEVIDTIYEDKKVGLAIKLIDNNNNIIDKDYYKNVIFKVGNSIYYPEEDNIIRINLGNVITDITKVLSIITSTDNINLDSGTYYFVIDSYFSDDGYYYDNLTTEQIIIPVNVNNTNFRTDYEFNVVMDTEDQIINKNETGVEVIFNILESGSLSNPNVRVSLYRKDSLTAYNQDYSLVDLQLYVSDTLTEYIDSVYYTSINDYFELNLITGNFDNTGYKFIFDLYDGTIKVGTIEKYFIVR